MTDPSEGGEKLEFDTTQPVPLHVFQEEAVLRQVAVGQVMLQLGDDLLLQA